MTASAFFFVGRDDKHQIFVGGALGGGFTQGTIQAETFSASPSLQGNSPTGLRVELRCLSVHFAYDL